MVCSGQTGNVQGVISDNNGIYVPGANVMIPSISKGAISDFDGRFSLVNLPVGTYDLQISYIGYAEVSQPVTVTEGTTTRVTIAMQEKNFELQEVEVSAYGLSGQAKALNAQKNNINITNVVSTDQIGKFPDANIGDAVKRIPGITMQVDQGEARNIIVRGLSPQLNSVTLNGSRIPSAEGDNRNIQMDLIPSDMIQTIEVNKAVTPDMDADALGGSINLITKTAPQGFRLSTTLGSGVNFITDKPIYNGSFLVGDRTKNGKFGWMVSAAINDNDFGSDNVEAEWSDSFEYNTGEVDGDGESILEEVEVLPYAGVSEQRTYLVQRVRRSFAANLDFQLDANNNIFLKSMYNWRDDRENRFALSQEILDAEDIGADDFAIANGSLIRFPVEVKRQTKGGIAGGRIKNRRLEDQRMQNYTLGGDHLVGAVKIDWMASYAKASEERLNERYAEFESEYGINNDITNPRYPLFTAVNVSDSDDLSNFSYNGITEQNGYTEEEDMNFFVNVEFPVALFGAVDGNIKMGARGRFKEKLRDNDFFEYDLEALYPTLADVPVTDQTDPDFLAGSQYKAGSYADRAWLGGLELVDGEDVPDEYLRENFEVSEDVWAGYAMADQKITDKLNLLLGIRLEHTSVSATGNQIEEGETAVGKITEQTSYTNILPGLHLKYDLSDRTVLRFAWTNTLARPNYADLTPTLDISREEGEIFQGNPDLDPTTSMNFDVMAEHYFESVGLLSGGLFYKGIQDFVYRFISITDDESFGPGTDGFELSRPLNGDKASVFGLELGFQRQLDFLPGFAKNFSIYTNYTYLSSTADGIRNEDGEERTDLDLPNTAPNMFNGSLGYADKHFSARLSANFSDSYIDEIGSESFFDRYYDTQFFLDFNASYAITNNLRIYADLNNITNQPLRFYQGISERTQQVEFYDRRLTVGIKYDLFKKP
ncbi:MAG: TonB-dependent receptor [Sediminicola sp.]